MIEFKKEFKRLVKDGGEGLQEFVKTQEIVGEVVIEVDSEAEMLTAHVILMADYGCWETVKAETVELDDQFTVYSVGEGFLKIVLTDLAEVLVKNPEPKELEVCTLRGALGALENGLFVSREKWLEKYPHWNFNSLKIGLTLPAEQDFEQTPFVTLTEPLIYRVLGCTREAYTFTTEDILAKDWVIL
jgi:hypothetical protein